MKSCCKLGTNVIINYKIQRAVHHTEEGKELPQDALQIVVLAAVTEAWDHEDDQLVHDVGQQAGNKVNRCCYQHFSQ